MKCWFLLTSRYLLLTGFFLGLFWIEMPPALADNQVSEAQLRQLRQNIQALQTWLSEARDEHSQLQNQLRETETQMSRLVREMNENTQTAQTLEARLNALERERRDLEQLRDQQAEYLRQQIRAAYAMGRQEYLKVLLNQQTPDRVARLLRYYDYINRERTRRIDAYLQTARQLDQVREEIVLRSQTLQEVRLALQQKRQALIAEQRQREGLVAQLGRDIAGRDQELQQLLADQRRLEQLLAAVTEAIVQLPPPRDARPFAQMRGQLPWPVDGRVLSAFGSLHHDNRLVSRGLTIDARQGTDVRAIHGGRVVFADWMRGFGFLLIIDHGGGYMSLYGHNQTLRYRAGDWVNAGDVVASVGSTGGRQNNALYFEIRHQGRPLDPITWIARR